MALHGKACCVFSVFLHLPNCKSDVIVLADSPVISLVVVPAFGGLWQAGNTIWPQNSWVAVAKSVCHAPEYPLCKTVGRVIPYQGVVRVMVQVGIFYCSRAEPSLSRGKVLQNYENHRVPKSLVCFPNKIPASLQSWGAKNLPSHCGSPWHKQEFF